MRAEDFIANCQDLAALDLSESVARTTRVAVEERMAAQYAIPFPLDMRDTFDRRGKSTRNRRGQWHELIQHLTDLAYLSLENFRQWHAVRRRDEIPPPDLLAAVLRGVEQFVAEDDYPDYAMLRPFPPSAQALRLDWVEQHLALVVFRLGTYISFDGDLSIRPDYVVGEASAYGRSLAYRIRVYFHDFLDRRSGKRKAYFDRDLLPYLASLNNSLGNNYTEVLPDKEAVHLDFRWHRLLLDAQFLFDEFRRANRFLPSGNNKYFLVYDLEDSEEERRLEIEETKREERRMRRLQRRARKKIEEDELHVDTGQNRLGVRLLQLGLWRGGFYTGVLDGAFGPLSHAAIGRMIAQELEHNEYLDDLRGRERRKRAPRILKDKELQKIQLSVDAGENTLWVIDLKLIGKLLDAYVPPPPQEADEEEDLIWQEIREAGQEDRLDRDFIEKQRDIHKRYGNLSKHSERRVYYGLRGLLRGAFRAIGRVIKWIEGQVKKLLGAVFDFVKSVVKRIQEGISHFFEGFRYFGHYLLGKPFVSLGAAVEGEHPVLSTSFRIDFDSIGFMTASATADDVRAHIDYLRRMREGIEYFLDTVIDIIRFVSNLKPPMGWLRMGIAIARWVRELLRGRKKEAVA